MEPLNTPSQPLGSPADGSRRETRARWLERDAGDVSRRDATLALLRSQCRRGQASRPSGLDLRDITLAGEDLSNLDLSGFDLSGADLTEAKLNGTLLSMAELQGASLYRADLRCAEFLAANLRGASLNECHGAQAGFGKANLEEASLISAELSSATFSAARLAGADLRAANLQGAAFRSASLIGANFTRGDLRGADLKESDVSKAIFEMADLREARLLGLSGYRSAKWVGVDIRGLDERGAHLVQRFIRDENYLFEFRTRSRYHRALYWIWWATSDCGRSLLRWTFWVLMATFLFAGLYTLVEVDFGRYETPFSPLYFSFVTLTTLGYGDVVPASVAAQVVAVLEACAGYLGLGGLLSILSNKMARRAD